MGKQYTYILNKSLNQLESRLHKIMLEHLDRHLRNKNQANPFLNPGTKTQSTGKYLHAKSDPILV